MSLNVISMDIYLRRIYVEFKQVALVTTSLLAMPLTRVSNCLV